MTRAFNTVAIGGELAVLLPEELRERLGISAGEPVDAHTLASSIEASAAALDQQNAVLTDVMTRRRAALAELAR